MNDLRATAFTPRINLGVVDVEPSPDFVSVFSDLNYTRTKSYIQDLASDIKEGVEVIIDFEEKRPNSIKQQSLNRRDINAEWFRIRESALRVLDVIKNIDIKSQSAMQVRTVTRGILRTLDSVSSIPDKNLRRDIGDLKKSLSYGVSKITRHHNPEYLRNINPGPDVEIKPAQLGAEKKVEAAPVQMSANPDTLKALELIETAETLLSSEVDIRSDEAYHYLQQNLIQLHGLCLTGEINKKRLIEAFNPATHHLEGIEFLLHSIRCVLEGKPSPLVKRAAERSRRVQPRITTPRLQVMKKKEGPKRKRLDRSEGPLKIYNSVNTDSALGRTKILVEKSEASTPWAVSVVRSCEGLNDTEVMAVAYRLKELAKNNVCAGSALVALMVRRMSLGPLKSMVYNYLQSQYQNGTLDASVKTAMRLAEKRTGVPLFKFLPAV